VTTTARTTRACATHQEPAQGPLLGCGEGVRLSHGAHDQLVQLHRRVPAQVAHL